MSGNFRDLRLAAIGKACTPQLILHIGAGSGAGLAAALETGAARVVLVEADPKQAARARNAARGDARTEVIELAVGDRAGMARLHRLSLSGYSGLRAPTGLKELFPGLREEGTAEVEITEPEALVARIGLPAGREAVLILDARGEEERILRRFAASGGLLRFTDILLTLPEIALFEDSADGAALRALLEAEGFRMSAFDWSDRDLPQAHFHIDESAHALAAAHEELAELRQRCEEEATAHAALTAQIESLKEEREAAGASHRAALAESEEQANILRNERDALKAEAERLKQKIRATEQQPDLAEKAIAARAVKNGEMVDAEFARLEAQLEIMRQLAELDGQR